MSSHPPPGSLYAMQPSPHMVGAYHHHTSPGASPQRLRIHNPDPTPSRGSSPSSGYSYEESRAPPPPQPGFIPQSSSPLRPRNNNNNNNNNRYSFGFNQNRANHTRSNSVPPEDSQFLVPKGTPRRLRPSKSSEILRKLAKSDQNAYHSLSDEEDDPEERLRLPTDHRSGPRGARGVSGAATTFAAIPPPQPQPRPPTYPSDPYSDPFTSPVRQVPRQAPRQAPYPAEASPNKPQRPLSEMVHKHSLNEVLLSAETGGMIASADGEFIKGKGPGELFGVPAPAPRGPRAVPKSPVSSPLRLPPVVPMSQPSPASTRNPHYPPIPSAPSRLTVPQESPRPMQTFPVSLPTSPARSPHPSQEPPRQQQRSHTQELPQQQHRSRTQEFPPQRSHTQEFPQERSYAQEFPPLPVSRPDSGSSGHTGTRGRHKRSHSDGEALATLARQGTLFHPASSQERAARELDVMLGKPRSRRLSANRLLPAPETAKPKDKELVRLEAAKKGRARVELDVLIERECVVEGCEMRGRIEVVVRGGKRGKGLRVGGGKLRVLGFEETENGQTRHIFYQQQYPLREFVDPRAAQRCTLFGDAPDEEGFHAAKEGTHALSFCMRLPVDGGAKGCYTAPNNKGPNVRYVVVGSIKLHIPSTGKRAIAHFYRPLVVLPYHDPSTALAPSPQPVVAHTTSGLGWRIGGEKGKVEMQVALGRRNWVAGQRVWCQVAVRNQSHKKINRCTLAILQEVSTFGVPKGNQRHPPVDVVRSKIAEESVEAEFMEVGSGHVTSKSWWTGLEPGESNRWDMSVPIPTGHLSISRSRFVEVTYKLRVTLNNSIYVDVPVRLINFLSIDPPPMPGDARRSRMSIRTQVPAELDAGVAGRGAGYTLEQIKGDDGDAVTRQSSTTLDMDNMVAACASNQPDEARPRMLGDDLHPRPPSPGSVYSTMNGRSDAGMSVDEEERNHLVVEAARRDGREQSLAVINRDHSETLLTDDDEDERDRDAYVPAGPPVEKEYPIGYDEPARDSSGAIDLNSDADISSSETESNATETDRTPQASPGLPPVEFSPVPILPLFDIPDFGKHPRDEYLSHISEEEEPIDDDMLTEIVSADGRGHGHLQGDDMDMDMDMDEMDYTSEDESDNDMAPGMRTPRGAPPQDDDTPTKAPVSPFTDERERLLKERVSLQDRLAYLCGFGKGEPVQSSQSDPEPETESKKKAPATYAVLPSRPKDVDFAEPIDIDTISLSSLSMEDDHRTFANGSPYQRPKTILSYSTVSWTDYQHREESAPTLPSPGGARDIQWGGTLTGRTISGRSALLSMSDDAHSLSHEGSVSTLRARGAGANLTSQLSRLSDGSESMSDDSDLEPPHFARHGSMYASSSGHDSFITANSDHDLPQLTTPEQSDSDSLDSPHSPQQPVYTRPLPAEPEGKPKRHSLVVPERFKPASPTRSPLQQTNRIVSEAESVDSLLSSTSTNLTSATLESVLPAVRARVAQIEMRSEALRKFSVASSAGLNQSPQHLNAPLSPIPSGRVSPNGRRSYTTALGSRSRSPASMSSPRGSIHSNTMSERSEITDSPYSGSFSLDSHPSPLSLATRARMEQAPPVPAPPTHHGLDAKELGGGAFARGITSPTSSIGHSRWSGSDMSHGNTLLSRANSTTAPSGPLGASAANSISQRILGPRGPRTRQTAISPATPPFSSKNVSYFPVSTASAATPTPLPLFLSVKSESASLEDGYSSDTYSDSQGHTLRTLSDHQTHHVLVKTASNASDGSGGGQFSDASGKSDWSTGWRGANVRLPTLR